jgi:hypothetical protein
MPKPIRSSVYGETLTLDPLSASARTSSGVDQIA